MVVLFRFLLLASLIFLINSEGYTGCFDPNDVNEEEETIRIGDRHTICLMIGSDLNWSSELSYVRYTFRPKADEYSKFHIEKSYNDLVKTHVLGQGSPRNVTYFLGVGQNVSYTRMYHEPVSRGKTDSYGDDENDKIFPFMTAMIDVKDGKIIGLVWDNSCGFCPKRDCLKNTYTFTGQLAPSVSQRKGCYLTRKQCDQLAEEDDDTTCDMNLYVIWTGTDIDGKPFQSSGYRFSAFPPSSIQHQFSNLLPDYPHSK